MGEIFTLFHIYTKNCHQILKLFYKRKQIIDPVEPIARLQTSATLYRNEWKSTVLEFISLDSSLVCVCICLDKNQHFFTGILGEIEH